MTKKIIKYELISKKIDNSLEWTHQSSLLTMAWQLKHDPDCKDLLRTETIKEVENSLYYKRLKLSDPWPKDELIKLNKKYDAIEQEILSKLKQL